jgi:UDP-N-acetylglucosamine 2-epimerase (non-hydrolysing)
MKVITIVGTRPEIIKLSRVIDELDKYTDHILVHSGQNYDYELNEIFFNDLGIRKPDYFLNAVGDNLAKTIANIIYKADGVFEKENPDALLLLGDTNSCLSSISAKRRKIPIFHMEAGNRCFDLRVPEEVNRKIVDHLSDINMPYTEHARNYLLNEGVKPETIIKTGSPMKEVISYHMNKINDSKIVNELKLKSNNYFLISAHREENVDNKVNFLDLLNSLNQLALKYKIPLVVSTHPRTQKKLDQLTDFNIEKNIQFLKPLGFTDYVNLQMNSKCVISDSGTITEESSILGFPAITIRQAHERPEGMDEGTLIMSGLKPENVLNAVNVVTRQHSESKQKFKIVNDYNIENVSSKVVRTIFSYTDFINRTVWKKTL